MPGLCRDRKWSLSDYQVAAEDEFCLVPARCDTVRRKERCRRCTRCQSHMMIIISNSILITNSIIIAASATTTATTTSHTCVALQCGMQVSRCHCGSGACFSWKCYRAIAELLQSISGTSPGSPRSAMAAMQAGNVLPKMPCHAASLSLIHI